MKLVAREPQRYLLFQLFNQFIRHEAFAVSYDGIYRLPLGIAKSEGGMNMIGHNNISCNVMSFAFQIVEPSADGVVISNSFSQRAHVIVIT